MHIEPLTMEEIGEIRRALPLPLDSNDPTIRLIVTLFSRDFRIRQLEDEVARLKAGAPASLKDPHIVLCRDDGEDESASKGPYRLATRTVFESQEAAALYAVTIAPSRDALIVPIPITEMRTGDERGRLAYWQRLRVLT